jgi:hypothetical protein
LITGLQVFDDRVVYTWTAPYSQAATLRCDGRNEQRFFLGYFIHNKWFGIDGVDQGNAGAYLEMQVRARAETRMAGKSSAQA